MQQGELIHRTLGGDSWAFNVIVTREYPRALSIARRLLNDKSMAEDAVQEAFFTAYRSLTSLREHSKFDAWFHSILRSQCARLRRDRPELSLDLLDDHGIPTAAGADPARALEERRSLAAFQTALDALPHKLHEVSVSYYLDGLTTAEISEMLKLSEGAIKNACTTRERPFPTPCSGTTAGP